MLELAYIDAEKNPDRGQWSHAVKHYNSLGMEALKDILEKEKRKWPGLETGFVPINQIFTG